jgi:hypothetical protein
MSAQTDPDTGDDRPREHPTSDVTPTEQHDATSLHEQALAVVEAFRRRNHALYERLRRT